MLLEMFVWTTPRFIRRLACTAAALTAAAGASPGWAQVQIHGRVIEEGTEQPVDGVHVTLLNREGRSLGYRFTDERGAFTFEVRGTGMVRLRADRIGYRETLTPILFFDNFDLYRVEIRMH
ncbi:MAG: carboxypeptidase regulatory-like domain-containing protein, partial [Gemmatimonadetes bacterium]|nr:carboxypeptidase regulatory-like domain-containing protein [Gemmatimonadota bacterium]